MPRSARIVYRGVHGVIRANYFWPGVINTFSAVQITAGEVVYGGTEQAPPGAHGQNFHYNLGAASIWVSNVCPHENPSGGQVGGVEFLLHVDWDSPLDVAVTLTVEDTFPESVQGYQL